MLWFVALRADIVLEFVVAARADDAAGGYPFAALKLREHINVQPLLAMRTL